MVQPSELLFQGVVLLYSLAVLLLEWRRWLGLVALGLEVVMALLFLRESFLLSLLPSADTTRCPTWQMHQPSSSPLGEPEDVVSTHHTRYPGVGAPWRETWTLGMSTGQTGGHQVSCYASEVWADEFLKN